MLTESGEQFTMREKALPQRNISHGGMWYVLAAAVLWGTTGTSQGLAPAGGAPTVIGAVRLAIGGLALLMLAMLRGSFKGGGRWPLVRTITSAFFVAGYQLCFFAGVARTGVAAGTMIAIGSAPVAAGVLGYLVRKEHVGRRWMMATLISVIGCILLAAGGGGLRSNVVGILLAVGAGLSYAAYTVSIKGLLDRHAPDAVMAVVFCLAALLLSPLLFTSHLGWLAEPRGIAVALHLGVLATAVSYGFFARGLKNVSVGTAATLSLAEPLTAALLGVVVLGERLSLSQVSGIALLFTGLVVLALGEKNAKIIELTMDV
jgi:drug/metabolite transporter, DME family